MKDPTLADLMKAATETILPEVKKTSARSNAPAFGIVNHDDGRRLTLNRELSEKLSLDDSTTLVFMPVPSMNRLLVAAKLPMDNALRSDKVKNKAGVRTVYSAPFVYSISKCFHLDYSKHTSLTFTSISIDSLEDGTPVAIVDMTQPSHGTSEEGMINE